MENLDEFAYFFKFTDTDDLDSQEHGFLQL
jgi:hypothetical protein